MKIPKNFRDFENKSRPLKCHDCAVVSNAVYISKKYDKKLCVPCLMARLRNDINKD
jgi:hypothetical protein